MIIFDKCHRIFRSTKKLTITSTLIITSISCQIIAQDFSLEASLGVLDLTAGFEDDPLVVPIAAGGQKNAAELGVECHGLIADRPDVSISYSSGEYELNFAVFSENDTTLVINSPTGDWFCNDDYNSLNPHISFEDPESGRYDIWIGVYSEEDELSMAQLLVSEASINDIFRLSDDFGNDEVHEDTPSGGSGTAFVINNDGHLLTNNHVIEGCSEITFQIRGSATTGVSLISANTSADLALLKIDSFDANPAKFAPSSSIQMGAELFVYGFPLADDLSAQGNFTNGIVSAASGLNDDMTQFQMTAPIQPGNSGGPVLNRNGNVIGVVVATANQDFFRQQRGTDTQNINFAIHGEVTKRFLESNNIAYEEASSEPKSLQLSEVARRAQEYTGILICM